MPIAQRLLISLLVVLPAALGGLAPAEPSAGVPAPDVLAALDAEAQALVRGRRTVGMGLAMVVDGEVVFARGWGSVDRDGGGDFDVDHVLPVGELGELYLAALALRLEQHGRVDFERPLSEFELDDRGLGVGPPNLRQVLSHHSGVVGIRLAGMYVDEGVDPSPVDRPSEPLYLLDRPGRSSVRSSLAVEQAVRSLEAQAGESIEALLARDVTGALGLAPARFPDAGLGPLYSRGRAEPARLARERVALGMAASLEELSAFTAALMPGARPEWLEPDRLGRLYSAQNREAYPDLGQRSALAFRLESDPRPDVGPLARIDSNFPASHASVRMSPDHRVAVVTLANFGDSRSEINALSDQALDALLRLRLPALDERAEDPPLPASLPLPGSMSPDRPASRYATFGGLLSIDEAGGRLEARWLGWRFSGEPRGDGWFRPRLRVLRIPIGFEALSRVAIRPVRLDGQRLLLATGPSGRAFVIGSALATDVESGPEAAGLVGSYRILTTDALLERGRVDSVDLVLEDGLLKLQFSARGGPLRASLDMPLLPEGPDHFRIPGLGPGLGDRLRVERVDGRPPRLHFSGHVAERSGG